MIKAVIFDIDGTLIDTVDLHAESWVEAFKDFGYDVEFEKVRQRIGEGADRLMPELLPKGVDPAELKRIEEHRSELFKSKYFPRARAFPQVRELFEHIRKRGQKVVLGSSCTADEISAYKKLAGINDLTDAEATSDNADSSKPAPDIFNHALKCIAPIQPAEAIVIGDTVYDARAAGKAGLAALGVLCGGTSEQALREAGCMAVYRDPKDLLDRYEQSPLAS